MPGNNPSFMRITVADAAGLDFDPDLLPTWLWNVSFYDFKRPIRLSKKGPMG
jgi:hypothetical protein